MSGMRELRLNRPKEPSTTRQDYSPTKTDYTQGYAYQGYGEKYLSILQNTFMAVSGQVMEDPEGKPLPKVDLKVFQGETLMATARSDSRGFYNLSRLNLPPGVYEVRANSPAIKKPGPKFQVDKE